jgi:ABC-type Fe3+/spermidine/putrescine transport system ATPase subunit
LPTLDVRGVSKAYGNIKALDDVWLHIEDKEYVCIVGPSGCGKSTLIKCVAGIIQPTEGEILVDGHSVLNVPIEDRKIGYVFQDIALFPHLSVKQNLSYGLAVRNASANTVTTVTNEMLDLVKMRDRSKSYPRELSGGAQQKVAVGRAIESGSHLFLLDEPLGALDALVRAELRYELRRLASDLGLTVIHVTHDQEEALSIADRVVIMKGGRVVEVGKPAEIYHSPQSLFTENFVGETNLLEGTIMEIAETSCKVKVGTHMMSVLGKGKKVGQKVVVAVRPEFITLGSAVPSEWEWRIKEVSFLGGLTRYTLEDDGGLEILAHVPSGESRSLRIGERTNASFGDGEHMLLFDYPIEGLEKELALE